MSSAPLLRPPATRLLWAPPIAWLGSSFIISETRPARASTLSADWLALSAPFANRSLSVF